MHLYLSRQRGMHAAEIPDQLLDADIDVGTIESRDAGFDEAHHIPDGLLPVDLPVIAGEMPATLDEPRDGVTVNEGITGNHGLSRYGRGTAVVSDRLK